MMEEKWHECDGIGTIKVVEKPKIDPNKEVENLDDYDVRHGLGGRFHNFKSRLDRMEC